MTAAAAFPRSMRKALVAAAALLLAACQTARLDAIAPGATTSSAAQPAATTAQASQKQEEGRPPPGWPPPGSARDTGSYPNLNVKPPAATTQITDKQEATSKSQLNALRDAAQAEPVPTVSNQGTISDLGQRPEQVLKEIEEGSDEEGSE